MKYLIVFFLLFGVTFSQDFTIKKNGNIKTIDILEDNGVYTTNRNYKFQDNSNIAIQFFEVSPTLIDDFESRYNLELDEILVMGDYIYKQNDGDILLLLESISKEDNVKKIVPLWRRSMGIR